MSLLEQIEAYYDLAPRANATVEEPGPFVLFVGTGPWPYYARPRLGASEFDPADIEAVRTRQRELGVPESFEWVDEVSPSLVGAAATAGLEVHRHPLLVLDRLLPAPAGPQVRVIEPDDAALPAAQSAIAVAFGAPAADPEPETVAFVQSQIAAGSLIMAVAETDVGPVGGGSAIPRGATAEITGIGVAPEHQRRGLGLAITAALTAAVKARGVELVFLSAADDRVAGIYERAGFRRSATACIAEPAD